MAGVGLAIVVRFTLLTNRSEALTPTIETVVTINALICCRTFLTSVLPIHLAMTPIRACQPISTLDIIKTGYTGIVLGMTAFGLTRLIITIAVHAIIKLLGARICFIITPLSKLITVLRQFHLIRRCIRVIAGNTPITKVPPLP